MQETKGLSLWHTIAQKRMLVNALLVLGTVVAAAWFLSGFSSTNAPRGPDSATSQEADSDVASVRLPKSKLAVASITSHAASTRSLTHTHTVPGRIEYDAAHRLDVRLPTECVVKEVCVTPGQHVEQGAKLAVLTSEQIGLARDAVVQAQEALEIAQHHLARTRMIEENVADLLSAFKQRPPVTQLEAYFTDRPLDEHRSQLFGAYSDFLLAEQVQADSNGLSEQGVLSVRLLQERRAQLERSQAAFQGACEETSHHAHVAQHTAEVEVARANRALKIRREKLDALLGPYADKTSVADASLNELVLKAPFTGTITARQIAVSEVVPANSTLFTIADTRRLWVTAQIREQDWAAASLQPGQTVRVRTPAAGDREFSATIDFVGAIVDPETLALPLVASIENPDRLFKPGMFVWVFVPVEPRRQALAVPAGAVMRHEGQAFVFVAKSADEFQRIDVTTGLEADGWVEIRDGLFGGENVVDSGAFTLKSELLLKREEG